nr:immunoglobulin heavy chain junction region [Macaca mulatta]
CARLDVVGPDYW